MADIQLHHFTPLKGERKCGARPKAGSVIILSFRSPLTGHPAFREQAAGSPSDLTLVLQIKRLVPAAEARLREFEAAMGLKRVSTTGKGVLTARPRVTAAAKPRKPAAKRKPAAANAVPSGSGNVSLLLTAKTSHGGCAQGNHEVAPSTSGIDAWLRPSYRSELAAAASAVCTYPLPVPLENA